MSVISIKIAGTSYTLPQASLRSLVHSVSAGQPASLAGEIYTTAIPSTALAYGDLVELWVNSTRRFIGWLGPVTTGFDAQGSYVSIQARDILHRLRNTPLARRVVDTVLSPSQTGADGYLYTLSNNTTTEFNLFGGGFVADEDHEGYYRWEHNSSSDSQIASVCAYAGTVYSPGLLVGTLAGLSAKNQVEPVTNLDCLSALQRCTKYRPDAVMWVDASGTTPALHCITRSNCTAVTIDLTAHDRIRSWSLCAREDLRLLYLRWSLDHTQKEYLGAQVITTGGLTQVYEYGSAAAPADRRSELRIDIGVYSGSSELGTPWSEFPGTAAADYWAATSVLHHEGACTLYPPADVDLYTYGLGQVHNFTGGAAALETCAALVRAASYDHVAGAVALEYGPPDTLSPQDFIAGSASGALSLSPTPPAPLDPADPENPLSGSGDLPAQVTGELYNLFSVESTTGTVQTIDGTATLGGYSEFSPSAPPRKFLRKTAVETGSYSCTGGPASYSLAATGLYSWSGATLTGPVKTGDTAHLDSSDLDGYCPCGNPCPDFVKTSTTARADVIPGSYSTTGLCCGAGQTMVFSEGHHLATLDMEDDEQAAIARLGDTWADPIASAEKKTYWEQRTTGFSFGVRRCRLHEYSWTCSIYGLPVKVSVPLYKYAIGGTRPATPTATQSFILDLVQFGVTTTSPQGLTLTEYHGKATLPDWELPIEKGYVIEAGTPTITLL